MSDKTYAIAFDGTLVEGANPEQVKANVAKLFKAPLAKVEPLFCGKRIAIKKGLEREMALKYQAALRKCGAITQVVDLAAAAKKQAQAVAAKRAAQTKRAATAKAAQQPAATDGMPLHSVVKEAPTGEVLAGVEIDLPDRLVAAEAIPEPEIDISQFEADEVGATLVAPEPDVDPGIEIPDYGVAEAGTVIVEGQEFEELVVDLSGFSMAEPGEQIVEPEEVQTLQIDTSKLSVGS